MSAYADLMNEMYALADTQGKETPDDAWLIIKDVIWPNPHYTGEPKLHPEASGIYNPPKPKHLGKKHDFNRKKNSNAMGGRNSPPSKK